MKAFDKLFEIGGTQILAAVTIAALAGVAVAGPFIPSDVRDTVFQTTALASILELFLLVSGVSRRTKAIDSRVRVAKEDFSLIAPPHVTERELLEKLEATRVGSLKIICYGTNRYGRVLDIVQSRFPQMKTSVIVCAPQAALTKSDGNDIQAVLTEFESSNHVRIESSSVLPTVRAALIRSSDDTPVWVSISFYLVHRSRRGLKSEGLSPVVVSNVPGSRTMKILCEFVEAEFSRLKAS
jgi:hypothetical protein